MFVRHPQLFTVKRMCYFGVFNPKWDMYIIPFPQGSKVYAERGGAGGGQTVRQVVDDFLDRAEQLHIGIHRVGDIIHKTSTNSSQTKAQHGRRKEKKRTGSSNPGGGSTGI